MEKQYSVKFFKSFIECLQMMCQEHLMFDQVVEVSGYLSVEIDNAQKERYVLSEFLQNCGNIISESYCTKAFKTLPTYVRSKDMLSIPEKLSLLKKDAERKKENVESPFLLQKCRNETASTQRKKRKFTADDIVLNNENKTDIEVTPDDANDSGCIGSRSLSFLAASAKHTGSQESDSSEEAGLHSLVASIEKKINSSKSSKSKLKCNTLPSKLTSCLTKAAKKSSRSSSSRSSTPSIDLPICTSTASNSLKNSNTPKASKLPDVQARALQKSNSSGSSKVASSPSTDIPDTHDLNISSLRHLVSKSHEDSPTLKHRTAGMEIDIPPGQAYIEVADDVKEEPMSPSSESGECDVGIDLGHSSKSYSTRNDDAPSAVSTSLMNEPESIIPMVDSENSSDGISDVPDIKDVDSPVIIDLEDDDNDDDDDAGDDNECDDELVVDEDEPLDETFGMSSTEYLGDDSDPFASSELRKLDTFKDYVKFAVKRLQTFLKKKKVIEPVFQIPPKKLDPLMSEFYMTVRNLRGEDFGASTLRSIQSYIEQYLRENGYPVSLTRDEEFSGSRAMLQSKLLQLKKAKCSGSQTSSVTRRDVDRLFKMNILGLDSATSLTNSMWFMNSVLFKVKTNSAHSSLRWGDISLKVDEYQNEYLELLRPNTFGNAGNLKIYSNNVNPNQCFLRMYKNYRCLRPHPMLKTKAPFYLSVDRQSDLIRTKKMKQPEIDGLLARMLIKAGVQGDKQIVNYDIL